MQPIWLIEQGVYGDEIRSLMAEIHRQGMTAELVPFQSIRRGAVVHLNGSPVAAEACVIGYGTFPFVRDIQLHQAWRPGVWCAVDSLACSTYFAYFGRYLLNRSYSLLPGVEAIRQEEWVFDVFGQTGQVFVRPSACDKQFVGRCVGRDRFAAVLAPSRYDPATLVVVAGEQPIDREWRLVVADREIVAGCQYARAGQRDIRPECPDEVRAFATEMLAAVSWRPDPMFMLDIGESGGRLWLIELNSFSGSWLYACDLHTLVEQASRLAERQWATMNRAGSVSDGVSRTRNDRG